MKHSQPFGEGQRNELALRSNGDAAPAPLSQGAAPDGDSVSLFEYWDILRRRKNSIILTCLGCGLLGYLVTLPMTPIYQARTSLEVVRQDDAVLALAGQTRAYASQRQETAFIRNQVEFLKSDTLIQRVVEKLQLHVAPVKKEEPGIVSRVMGWFKPAAPEESTPLQRAVKSASSKLLVTLSPESDIIEVYFDSPDKEMAAKFANTLAQEYIDQSLSSRWEVSQRTTEWMTTKLEDMKTKLADSERALQAYADNNQLIFTRDTDSVSEEELRRVQDELSRAMASRIERQSRYEMASESPRESLPEVVNDNTLRQYQMDLTSLRRQQADLLVSFTPEHPKVKHVQAQVAELETALERERGRIMGLLENEFQASERREELLSDRYKQQLQMVSNESAKAIQYNLMKREVDTNRDLYQSLMHRVKEAGVTSAISATTSRIVDEAKPPLAPYKPNTLLNAGLGLFAGLFLGVAIAFGRERADRTVRVPGELHFHLRVPELGVIPRFHRIAPGSSKRSYLASGKAKDPVAEVLNGKSNGDHGKNGHGSDLVTWQREPSVDAESFRAALTSILFCRNGNPPAVIAFTSPQSSEGKTTVVSNLAVALAEINRRVLIIDGDLRRPRLDRILGEPNGWGLSDLLRESESLSDRPLDYLVQKTKIPNVHAVFSGRRTANASNLLHSPRLPELIQRFRQEFDAVLIDAPPVLGLPDARVLGHLADGVILVLRAGKTTLETARAARQRLGDDGTAVLGTILNGWDPKEAKYGSYSYSGYAYEADEAASSVST
jgi:capsular exopolysaccharide synthesis family protein